MRGGVLTVLGCIAATVLWTVLPAPAPAPHAAPSRQPGAAGEAVSPHSPPLGLIARYSGCADLDCIHRYSITLPAALIALAGVQPDSAVLDVGCGVGKVAAGFLHYLGPAGRYHGFDMGRPAVEWLQRAYAAWPNFVFEHADIRSPMYNSNGTLSAEAYEFPYPADTFDVVYLGSVFTHDLPRTVRRYLAEIHRVLKPGGRAVVSWFLLNDVSEPLVRAGRANVPVAHALPGDPDAALFRVADVRDPEAAVAYAERAVLAWYRAAGFAPPEVFHGIWSGRADRPYGRRGWDGQGGYQDMVLALKPA